MNRAVAIARTTALSAFGDGTAGLGEALACGTALRGLPDDVPLAQPRAQKMMSRAAYLAARSLAELLARRESRDRIGYYLGVGASGGSLDDFMALLGESLVAGELSLARFGTRGLAACHPLLAFQLMNNFTLCHGAILEGIGGPNSAMFSRGAGTIAAIGEAVYAVASGECELAITGGADAPTHPATLAELARDGFVERGLVAADAVGLLELVPARAGDIVIEGCAIASGRGRTVTAALDEAVVLARLGESIARPPLAAEAAPPNGGAESIARPPLAAEAAPPNGGAESIDLIVIAPWGPPADDALRSWCATRAGRIISTRALGDSIAATPALALIAAADLLSTKPGRVLVLTLGVDGDPGAIVVARGPG